MNLSQHQNLIDNLELAMAITAKVHFGFAHDQDGSIIYGHKGGPSMGAVTGNPQWIQSALVTHFTV